MFGISLIQTGFLAATAAMAIPVLIHLLFRQKTRNVVIGSVRFLQQVVREHRRKRRVRQWILLALRVLAVLLLALLFARPYRDRSAELGLEQEVVLLLDRSASMSASGTNGVVFDRARAQLSDVIRKLDDNVLVHIGAYDVASITEVPLDQIGTLQTSDLSTDHGLALNWARDLLTASRRAQRRIILFTDAQRSGQTQTRWPLLPHDVQLELADVAEPLPRNIAIESAEAVRTEIRPDREGLVRVVLRNHGPLAVQTLQVRCQLSTADHTAFDLKANTDIPGRSTAKIEFPLPLQQPGVYQGQVEIETSDALKLDNRRWLAFEARPPDRVLVIDGQTGRSHYQDETYFLETALRLQTETDGQLRSFQVEKLVWESGEGFPDLTGYRALILANIRRFSGTDAARLKDYLVQGGNVLIFAGDQTSRESLGELHQADLLPGEVARLPVEMRVRVDQWNREHPALKCFDDPQQGDLRRLEFRQFLPLGDLLTGSQALISSGQHVIASERAIGLGRCVYWGSTADRDWTDLPRTPLYVPLMRQLVADLTGQLAERTLVSSRLVTKPGETSGIHPVAGQSGQLLVLNSDPRESNLDRITEIEIRRLAGLPESTGSQSSLTSVSQLKLPPDAQRPDELWPFLAWTLLLVLASETLLASRVHG